VAVGQTLTPAGVADIFEQIFDTTEAIGSDPGQLRDVVAGMLQVANRFRSIRNLNMDQQLWLDEHEGVLRDLKFEAQALQNKYEAGGAFDRAAMSALLSRFSRSCRGFIKLIRESDAK
jgi:hypothetical protein